MNYINLFKSAVNRNTDSIAIVDCDGKRRTSYGELDCLSDRAAKKLVDLGCKKGDFVVVNSGRTMEYIAAYLGVLKCGCVVVPVISDYPAERIQYIKSNCGAKFEIDGDFFNEIGSCNADSNFCPSDGTEPALLLYTSGSTGTPKGILYSAADIMRAAERTKMLFDGIVNLNYAAMCPLSFIAHITEYLTVFLLDGCSHMLSDRVRRSAVLMKEYYENEQITMGIITPQMLKLFPTDISYLKRVITGSERVSLLYSENYEIYNVYGMSETSHISVFNIDKKYENTPVGKALGAVTMFACDDYDQPVADGVEGEICIRGEFDVQYFKDPERTARAMVKNADGTVTVHTGDIGFVDENKNMVYVNRKDWMVKINGQRVETLEIETLLHDIPAVKDAAVKAFEDSHGQNYLVAYYVSATKVSNSELRNELKKKLPEYMIPRFFVHIDEMPKNINGKLDRKSLQPPQTDKFKAEYVAPANDFESNLCAAFENVLDCGTVGAEDDFFDLGGDSIKVLILLKDVGESALTADDIVSGRTPRGISNIYKNKTFYTTEHSDSIPSVCPLSPSQLGIYLDYLNRPETFIYNIPVRLKLPKSIDKNRFIEAVRTVASKHQVLKVTIGTPGGVPSMVYSDEPIKIPESITESIDSFSETFRRHFNLEKDSLYRFEYVSSPDGDAFFFDIHHIIFDGSSVSIFVRQIADVYNGGQCPDEELTVFDVAGQQNNKNDADTELRYREYFESKFGGVDCDSKPVPDRTEKNSFTDWGMISVESGNRLSSDDIKEYVNKNKISENALLLGAFGYALAKFNGSSQSVFTTAFHGRADRRLADTLGMFVKTLPFICRFDENEAPADYLHRAYDDYYTTKKNECISFNELADNYGISTKISFVYHSELFSDVRLGNKTVSIDLLIFDNSVSDIEIMVKKHGSEYTVQCYYLLSDYTEPFIRSLVDMLFNTVNGMITAPSLKEISLTDDESAEKLETINKTEAEYESSKTVIDLFREQAEKNPDNIAVVYKDKKYTYREADDFSDRLAKYLVSCGLERSSIVGVLVPRNEYITVCSLAVLKAGGAYLPMDTSYPPERLNLMIQDSGAKMLISTPELSELIDSEFTGKRIMITESIPETDAVLTAPKTDDLFCIIYTSGSTGMPKGVMYRHSNALVTTEYVKKLYSMDSASRIAAYASYGFDANIYDTYPAITSGAELHIISDDIRLDLLAVRDYFNNNGITHSVMTTQVGRQFALLGGLKTLKHLSVAGEKLVPLDIPDGFNMYNLYGPTEGSVITSGFLIDGEYRDIPIGKPVDNLKVYVVDDTGRLLPTGAVGELWIAGPHVTAGYLNRPEKTAEVFIDNPFSSDPEYSKVYRTGDVVRLSADGNLQFVGRADGQVKIRGFRVELTEIEEIIRRFDGIKDATVAAFDDANGGKYLAAYIVADTEIDINSLNAFIRADKPPYMVPAVTMQIDKIPLNQNQKVNKKALPAPKRTVNNLVMPENDVQQKIYDIVADIIGHRDFGIDSNIYDSGLTSIGALKLNVGIGTEFDVSVRIEDIRENNTVRKLEKMLSASHKQADYDILEDYPLTQTQQGIFIECSSKPNTVTYNMPSLIKLGENVDTIRLVSAVKAAINAHPYLKATLFSDENGDIRARRNDNDNTEINEVICDSLPERSAMVVPFNLLCDRLYRITVYKTADGNYLFTDFHHIVSDGVSQTIILSDISKAYDGQPVSVEKYTGFEVALDEKELRKSDSFKKAREYYDSIFKGCEPDCLPPLAPENDKHGAASVVKTFDIDTNKINAFCQSNSFTHNAFFNSAFGFAMSRFGNFEDMVYTTVYNGRNDSRLASSVTMLVKTIPVLIHTDENRAVSEMISETQKQLLDSMSNDIYSFAEISSSYGIRSNIIFVYQGDNFEFNSLCGEPAEFINVLPDVAKAPITVNVYIRNGKIEAVAEYSSEMFSEYFINNVLDVFECTVNGFIEKENVGEINLLTKSSDERLAQINNTYREFKNVPANLLFEEYTETHPYKTAVIAQDGQLTFGELNSMANRIAHWLVDNGVKKDTVVGFMLERTSMISVVELAILKSGGAFLGLLPDYPDDRVDFCLTDSGSPIIITTEEIKNSRSELFSDGKSYRTVTVEELLKNDNENNLNRDIPADSLAYCIYTSGSTGNPKGVMIEHHNLVNCAQTSDFTYSVYCGPEGGNVGLALSSISFDMSLFDNLLLLMNGKTVCIASDNQIHNPQLLTEFMLSNNVDLMSCTPSFLTNMLTVPEFNLVLRKLKTIVSGAEAFRASLYKEIKSISPKINLINGYGPSECTMTCCAKLIEDSRKITIGGPHSNTAFYVVDKFGNILPPYACGELIICGELVGRGYMNLPEKTSESFFTLRGKPAYHSGDMVRLNCEGEVEFFGRKDNQVKLRGFRVELDEIEKCMCSYYGITQSKVIVRNNGSEDFLAGFFSADHVVDMERLKEYLKSKLTHYMVPDVMMQLDEMPLTSSGKIDKKALPEIKKESRKTGRKAPKKSLEQQICELFGNVLSIDEYYADDDFFEMGGTSLSASKAIMQLMSKGMKVEYQDIFSYPTPEQLAEYIESQAKPTIEKGQAENHEESNEYSELLKYNTLEYAAKVKREPLGNVLLTGAVGFLGIHILKELIDVREGKIICLVRKGKSTSAESRIKNMLMYYFGSTFHKEFSERVSVIDADITDDDICDILKELDFDTVINCAACVKHYAASDIIEKINVHGVENLIKSVSEKNARMIQISTTSIPGVHTEESWHNKTVMHENELFVIDDMDNKYCISKYHAELKMLEAVKNGMRGKIIRVGNLMGRHSDGEFQINFRSNAFLNALRGFTTIGKSPISHATDPMSFSPIDITAKAIVTLAGTNDRFTAFHADNRFGFDEMQLINAVNKCGISIKPVPDKEYYDDYYRMLGNEKLNERLQGLVTNDRPDLHPVETDNAFTANILYRLGFSWPLVDDSYLERVITSLKTLGFFD